MECSRSSVEFYMEQGNLKPCELCRNSAIHGLNNNMPGYVISAGPVPQFLEVFVRSRLAWECLWLQVFGVTFVWRNQT